MEAPALCSVPACRSARSETLPCAHPNNLIATTPDHAHPGSQNTLKLSCVLQAAHRRRHVKPGLKRSQQHKHMRAPRRVRPLGPRRARGRRLLLQHHPHGGGRQQRGARRTVAVLRRCARRPRGARLPKLPLGRGCPAHKGELSRHNRRLARPQPRRVVHPELQLGVARRAREPGGCGTPRHDRPSRRPP